MFDHVMLRTQQFDIMTAFYEKALAPLGIKKLMAFESAAGLGRDAPGLWISKSSEPQSSVSCLRPGRKTMALRDRASSPRTITPPSSSTPTATTSKRRLAAPEPETSGASFGDKRFRGVHCGKVNGAKR